MLPTITPAVTPTITPACPFACLPACLLVCGIMIAGGCVGNQAEFSPSASSGEVLDRPSANVQGTSSAIRVGTEVTSLDKGKYRTKGIRYGIQRGSLQLVTESRYTNSPEHRFDYIETRLKLTLLESERERIALAVGGLGRFVAKSDQREDRIDNRTSSLFIAFTAELYPFIYLGGVRTNLYLDNRLASLGLEYQLSKNIKLLAEGDYLYSRKNRIENQYEQDLNKARQSGKEDPEKLITNHENGRGGIEIVNGDYYLQLLTGDEYDSFVIQIGGGF